jgi:hypothetical protein
MVVVAVVLLLSGASVGLWQWRATSDELTEAKDELRRTSGLIDTLQQDKLAQQTAYASRLEEMRTELERSMKQAKRQVTNRQPCGRDSVRPRVTFMPSAAPPGSRVEMRGHCFVGHYWMEVIDYWEEFGPMGYEGLESNYADSGCNFLASALDLEVTFEGGRMHGSFVVPSSGGCFQTDDPPMKIRKGPYEFNFGCHSGCEIGRFRVI